MAEAGR